MAQPYTFVFWIWEEERALLARQAPNFYFRNAGVFDFRIRTPKEIQKARVQLASTPLSWKTQTEIFDRIGLSQLAEQMRKAAESQPPGGSEPLGD